MTNVPIARFHGKYAIDKDAIDKDEGIYQLRQEAVKTLGSKDEKATDSLTEKSGDSQHPKYCKRERNKYNFMQLLGDTRTYNHK